MNTNKIEVLLDSALEHFSHGWLDLEKREMITYKDKDVFPPQVLDDVGSASYHFAAVALYLKRAYELVRAEEQHTEMVMEKINKVLNK